MFKIKVLGNDFEDSTSFLIYNENMLSYTLLDGGSLGDLSIEDKLKIDNIIISHCHLDHIYGFILLTDIVYGLRNTPINIYASDRTLDYLQRFIFNGGIWANFDRFDYKNNILNFQAVDVESYWKHEKRPFLYKTYPNNNSLNDFYINETDKNFILNVKSFKNIFHLSGAMGYIINENTLYTGDIGESEDNDDPLKHYKGTLLIFDILKENKNINKLIIECSYPNRLKDLALKSNHLIPNNIMDLYYKIENEIPNQIKEIYIFHLKRKYNNSLNNFEIEREIEGGINFKDNIKVKILKVGDIINL